MTITLILALILAVPMNSPQAERLASPAVEEHIHELIQDLPADSWLRRALLRGGRGDGVHSAWMDEMRKKHIKRVDVSIDIRFDRHGRPKHMSVSRTQYFLQYEGDIQISDSERLNAIRADGLEEQLEDLALQRAAKGSWVDVPHPRPHPFVGGTYVEFLDDEWLPIHPTIFYGR